MSPQDNINKILNYWYTLEFLSQERDIENLNIRKKAEEYKKKVALGIQSKAEMLNMSLELNKEESGYLFYTRIANEANECKMKVWGNITIYLGQIPREKCIELICSKLPYASEIEKTPEKNLDRIACISLQLSPNGAYIQHSLSLSPLLWAVIQVQKTPIKNLAALLSEKQYQKDVRALEEKYFSEEKILKDFMEAPLNESVILNEINTGETLPSIVKDATFWELLEDVENEFINKYSANNSQLSCINKIGRMEFQLFQDETVRLNKEDNNYTGLSHSYYTSDLSYIIKNWADGGNLHPYMQKELSDYVLALQNSFKSERNDLVTKPKDREAYFQMLLDIFDINNAPLGKWPSRFMPAFMQQAAVNLALGKFKVNGEENLSRIFSVNGPPGTGKTTLLKEVVVSNIVERAILLAEYEEPDSAFITNNFTGGGGKNNRYDQYICGWYSLKNDAINNYGVLVASCNNAAVENISKELPVSMAKDLSPLEEDPEELKKILKDIADIFSPDSADKDPGLYFTKSAQALLNDPDKEAWGLISAPLGNKKNLLNFYRNVLKDILGKMRRNDDIESHISTYKEARENFLAQCDKVKAYQEKIHQIQEKFREKKNREMDFLEITKQLQDSKSKYELYKTSITDTIKKYNEELQAKKIKHNELARKKETIIKELGQVEENINLAKASADALQAKASDIRKSCNIFSKIFSRKKYDAAWIRADDYTNQANEIYRDILIQENTKCGIENRLRTVCEAQETLMAQISKQRYLIENEQKTLLKEKNKVTRLEQTCSSKQKEYVDVCGEYNNLVKHTFCEAAHYCVLLDNEFLDKLLSDDTDTATKAQVANPWMTEIYNREREKLFALAMKMNQEFVLASKALRSNYKTLSQYWKFAKNSDNEFVTFNNKDKEKVVPALFQTLFLLVPVISTTFASVANLFKDVRQAGSFGLLIVDEAGQAQPQMALGALYRCRRAIIVGDPRQVEPVVTDDLLLLRKAYTDPYLAPYKSKTLSVQSFADVQNRFGTYLPSMDGNEWVGCPLLVHRRCVSPMYDISNQISYNNIMKQQTKEPEKNNAFILDKSQWINIIGNERGNRNHFVDAQGKKVCELLDIAFINNNNPDIFIISPFTTVISGIKDYIKNNRKQYALYMLDDNHKRIGTVHTFQGREANEVIFLLGCDRKSESNGAIRWVNNNIVNVAVTRAKYRLYVIGDAEAWKKSECVTTAKTILDDFVKKEAIKMPKINLDEQKVFGTINYPF